MSAWIEHTAQWLVAHNLQIPLFLLLLLLTFGEAAAFIGFVLPGETSLVIGGLLAAEGVWNFWAFLLGAITAAISGDSVGYEVGKKLGPRITESRAGRFVGAKRWKLAEHIFDKYGGWAIFFGRGQALLRALVPALAGMHKVPYRNFLKFNAAGGVVFSTVVVTLGYIFSSQIHRLESALKVWSVFALTLGVFAVIIIKRKLEKLIEEQ